VVGHKQEMNENLPREDEGEHCRGLAVGEKDIRFNGMDGQVGRRPSQQESKARLAEAASSNRTAVISPVLFSARHPGSPQGTDEYDTRVE